MQTNHLPNQIKSLRTAKGYSQEHLAEQTGLSLRTIQRIESGETEPRGDTLQRLAKALEVDIAKFTRSITPDALPQDKLYLTFIHISALSLIVFPLLGVLLPYILWVAKRNQIQGIDTTGKRVLNFQITWCIIFAVIYAFIISSTIFHFNISIPQIFNLGVPETFLLLIVFLYAYNIVVTIINSILQYNSKKQFYQPALKLLK
jgi:transcriptional regulator with XRE-family HTH domain